VTSTHLLRRDITVNLSVFGQNFKKTFFKNKEFSVPAPVGPMVNYYRFTFEMSNPKIWDLESPWLYQIQVQITDRETGEKDIRSRQFGLRSFRFDETGEPKGMYELNGRKIHLHGANTMGFEQQDVMNGDFRQLIDDILLAKICNMNFWRLTQRPVQDEVYEYCDRLGLLTQTDLPLFGMLRRNQFAEAVRQAGEMEKLVRNHPCNVVDTYINEPFPNAQGKGHRQLLRHELESFFAAASEVVRLQNPDRVIKPVDGDYDPPAPAGLPDNHCYTCWYNGHGVSLGKLNKGY
jgi:beta-galactosidase/beta-glucuronidase